MKKNDIKYKIIGDFFNEYFKRIGLGKLSFLKAEVTSEYSVYHITLGFDLVATLRYWYKSGEVFIKMDSIFMAKYFGGNLGNVDRDKYDIKKEISTMFRTRTKQLFSRYVYYRYKDAVIKNELIFNEQK